MRKLCSFLLFIMFFIKLNIPANFAYADSSYSGYAKVLENCVLYKSDGLEDDENNIIFTIPESYFVYVLDEISSSVLKVQYGKFVGFVRATAVVMCTFVPVVKTLDSVTCDIKTTSGTQVWNIPSADGLVLTTISAGTKNVKYIASCYGKVPTGGQSNVWFYVCYTPEFNSTNVYEGYVYSENVTNLSDIFLNLESNPEVLNENYNADGNVIFISSSLKTILIALIVIPIIVLILIILYKFSIKITKNTNKSIFKKNKIEEIDGAQNQIDEENNLKAELSKMKNLSFIKRHQSSRTANSDYPEFPHYDAEDDWL